jgi:hypothetical protein
MQQHDNRAASYLLVVQFESEHIRVFLHSILRLSDSDAERKNNREPLKRIHGG